jgi:hypothetical protein
MKKKYLLVIALIFVGLILLPAGCKIITDEDGDGNGDGTTSTTYYVSPEGSDSNDGSINSPWLTIQHGLDNLEPGNTLNISAGVYNEALYLDHSGSETQKIRIIGQSFDTVILDGINVDRDLFFVENAEYIEISGLTFTRAPRAGLRLSYAHHVEIRNCVFAENGRWGVFTDFSDYTTIENCEAYGSASEHGIYISNSSDNAIVRNSIVHHNNASGIQINADPSMGGDGISSDCLIENNLVYENGRGGGAAVNLASVRDSVIQNNMIYWNYAGGIAAWDDGQGLQWGSKDLVIIHNTVYFRPFEGRWAVSLKNGSTDAEIHNNILAGGRGGGFEFNTNCLSGAQIDYNIYYRANSVFVVTQEDTRSYTITQWQGAGYDRNSITDIPQNLFVSTAAADLHLKSSANAVDMGTDKGLSYDFEGDARPQGNSPDVGADEHN